MMLLPNDPTGRTLGFLAFGVALFPVARHLWFADVPPWRYWAGLAVGCAIAWGLDAWRTAAGWSDRANLTAGLAIVGVLTLAFFVSLLRNARRQR